MKEARDILTIKKKLGEDDNRIKSSGQRLRRLRHTRKKKRDRESKKKERKKERIRQRGKRNKKRGIRKADRKKQENKPIFILKRLY